MVHSEDTLLKVYLGLAAAGITGQQATDAVNQMQNQGILFREKEGGELEHSAHPSQQELEDFWGDR